MNIKSRPSAGHPPRVRGGLPAKITKLNASKLIQRELPNLIADDPLIRDFILRTVSNYYAGKQETESKFERILAELQCDREALVSRRGLWFVFGREFPLFVLEKLKVEGGAICFYGSQGRSRTRAGFADRAEVVGGDLLFLKI